jgi:hypothetical protein
MSLPTYNHTLVTEFINYPEGLPNEKIDEGLALPRESFIEDLENFITDLQTRREWYYKEVEKNDNFYLLDYAINFLSILKAKESFPKLLEIINEEEEFTVFWFSEYVEASYISFLFYPFFKNDFDSLFEIIIKKSNNNLIPSGLINITAQVAIQEPNRREEVINFYTNLIEFVLKLEKQRALFFEYEIDAIINSVLLIEGKELKEFLLKLYAKKLTDPIFHNEETIMGELETPNYSIRSNKKLNLELTPYQVFEKSMGDSFTHKLTREEMQKQEEEFRKKIQEKNREMEYALPLNYYDPKTDKSLYSRNDKVTVKYQDGKVVKDTKYKKAEKDVKAGKCEVIN